MVDNRESQQQLFAKMMEFKYDPYKFALYAFPWGVEGKPLENEKLRRWQIDEFGKIRVGLLKNKLLIENGGDPVPIKIAIAGGRGIGKSAFFGMLNMWFMSCWVGGNSTVTANTDDQLRKKTMSELGRWHSLCVTSGWFKMDSMKLQGTKLFVDMMMEHLSIDGKLYGVFGINWSQDNPDSFAGTHNNFGTMVQFDEASAIIKPIWVITEGVFTERNACLLWVVIGNSRNNTGSFYDCFQEGSLWNYKHIAITEVNEMSQSIVDSIINTYGKDSDEYRVEVLGQFPLGSYEDSFISRELIGQALGKEVRVNPTEPLIMGVDVAHLGSDKSVVRFRQGKNTDFEAYRFEKLDGMKLANELILLVNRMKPDVMFVDATGGFGVGPIDRMVQLGYGDIIVPVHSSSSPSYFNKTTHYNKKAEMWDDCLKWLMEGGAFREEDTILAMELGMPKKFIKDSGKIIVEPKKDLKKRLGRSPDDADAFVLTFAEPVKQRVNKFEKKVKNYYNTDYNAYR